MITIYTYDYVVLIVSHNREGGNSKCTLFAHKGGKYADIEDFLHII